MVSGLDDCLTSNLTAVQSLCYSALSILVKSLLAYISNAVCVCVCVCVCVGGGGGGGGGGQAWTA